MTKIDESALAAISEVVKNTVLHRLSAIHAPLSFVQVGGNDGITDDPIHDFIVQYGWTGVIVEPVPTLFERLRQTYRETTGIQFEMCACSDSPGIVTFYHVNTENDLGLKISSFSLETIMLHADSIPNLKDIVVPIEVSVKRVSQVIDDTRKDKIDAIFIDAEGHDDSVVRGIDLNRHRPQIIYIEHKHLSYYKIYYLDRELLEAGYRKIRLYTDTLYYLNSGTVSDYCASFHDLSHACFTRI
ncbi:FkbM family methyltransferase [Mesorhizobium sp. M0909]|uniref:FkbM family methyltransferase n=1 Tax=Mesorhizobium sp. M0909 TaxID=2957024 RepID=UPI00333A26C9